MKREIKRRCVYGMLLCLSMNLLAGCKEKTVDYNMESATESMQKEDGESDTVSRGKKELKQFAGEPAWDNLSDSEGWRAENTKGEEVDITVYEAEVTVPNAEEMYVVEVQEPEFDAAYKKQMSERIFGDGEVYYNDLAHLPRKGIEERHESCQAVYQLAQRLEEGEIALSYGDIEHFPERYQFDPGNEEGWKDLLEQELLSYDSAMETAGDAYMPVSEYDADEYLGTYSGIDYELAFADSNRVRMTDDGPYINGQSEDGCFINCRGKEILFQAKDIYQVCPEEVKEVDGLYYKGLDLSKENQCSLPKEVAEKAAQRFVDELKLDYSVYTNCESLGWWKGTNFGSDWRLNYFSDGYIFYFDAGVDTVSFTQFGTQQTDWNFRKLKKESEEPQYFLKAQIEVYVNDKGVIGMRAYNPIETIGVSKGVDLLPLDTIKGIIKEQVTDHYKEFRFKPSKYDGDSWVQFERLELIYFRIRDKENAGDYSYIPVWRLSGGSEIIYPKYLENPVLINAIDGSVIDFYEET